MADIPQTSITLLKTISADASSVRWNEFFNAYLPTMKSFLRARYPYVDADDAIQETMIALMKALPNYHYTPDEKGNFRNWLIGILSHKAADIIAKNSRQAAILETIKNNPAPPPPPIDDEKWKAAAMEAAIDQLMSDVSTSSATREVFRHVALMHESPESVAAQFGIAKNNVYQIKNRMIRKLAEMVQTMTQEINAS